MQNTDKTARHRPLKHANQFCGIKNALKWRILQGADLKVKCQVKVFKTPHTEDDTTKLHVGKLSRL